MNAMLSDQPKVKKIDVPAVVDQLFIESVVALYKDLLSLRMAGLQIDLKRLEFHFEGAEKGGDEDFDLVFLSYLALVRQDFPGLQVDLHFYTRESRASDLYYKVIKHRVHLRVTTQSEVFGLYLDGQPEKRREVEQSDSFWPPLLVRPDLVPDLFLPSGEGMLLPLLSAYLGEGATAKDSFTDFRKFYTSAITTGRLWNGETLSGLYLLGAMSKLPVSPGQLLSALGVGGVQARASEGYSSVVLRVVREEEILRFSQVERYCFSLLLGNVDLLGEASQGGRTSGKTGEKSSGKKMDRQGLHAEDLAIYEHGLRGVVKSARAMAFGLYELAKNITEHTESRRGMVTARKYSLARLKRLKRVNPSWLKQFAAGDEFLDINVIDTGSKGICSSYRDSLLSELDGLGDIGGDEGLLAKIGQEYAEDVAEVGGYTLSSFFNFNSVKLFHQINRSKARLGLLIFSQTVLRDAKGFVKIASNDFGEQLPLGYALFEEDNSIIDQDMSDFYRLGTNYNFLIPLSPELFGASSTETVEGADSGTPSSLFLEFLPFDLHRRDAGESQLNDFAPVDGYGELGKYEKLDKLREDVLVMGPDQLLVLDFRRCCQVLESSSDWIRFLANVQFSSNGLGELIVTHMPVDLYMEIINILRVFSSSSGSSELGFWKQGCYVLFFLPIGHFREKEGAASGGATNFFWFNSLLCGLSYQHFINVNIDINHYHHNLLRLAEPLVKVPEPNPPQMSGKLFSSSGKLFNFELVLHGDEGITFFEETVRSLVDIEINDGLR